MKILLATDGETLDSKIAKRFGHAHYYLIYDSELKTIDARKNSGHSDDHAELVSLVNESVLHFIVGNIGPIAFKVLDRANAKMYLARRLLAKDALDKFLNIDLEQLTNSTLKRSIEGH